jgi:hypothetical protein
LLEVLKRFKEKINTERKKSGKEELDEEKVDMSKDDGKDD